MIVVAEFEKPAKCEECPCFYQTEGTYYNECQLTHKEIENYFIVDKSCPLKVKENERMTGEEINDPDKLTDDVMNDWKEMEV